jgi:hypothetical protein
MITGVGGGCGLLGTASGVCSDFNCLIVLVSSVLQDMQSIRERAAAKVLIMQT